MTELFMGMSLFVCEHEIVGISHTGELRMKEHQSPEILLLTPVIRKKKIKKQRE